MSDDERCTPVTQRVYTRDVVVPSTFRCGARTGISLRPLLSSDITLYYTYVSLRRRPPSPLVIGRHPTSYYTTPPHRLGCRPRYKHDANYALPVK